MVDFQPGGDFRGETSSIKSSVRGKLPAWLTVRLIMTTPEVTEIIVRDCAEAGIRRVWMYRGIGKGAVSPQAVHFCQEHGIQVVPGECPFMFWQGAGGTHRVHGLIRKLTGRYPRHAPASIARAA